MPYLVPFTLLLIRLSIRSTAIAPAIIYIKGSLSNNDGDGDGC